MPEQASAPHPDPLVVPKARFQHDVKNGEREHDLWVFGYGSLMWRPGFAYEEAQHARLTGYRRCFCIYSVHHRGTTERPGMVLGLDRGGACEGIAYRVSAANAAQTTRYLRAREQVNGLGAGRRRASPACSTWCRRSPRCSPGRCSARRWGR